MRSLNRILLTAAAASLALASFALPAQAGTLSVPSSHESATIQGADAAAHPAHAADTPLGSADLAATNDAPLGGPYATRAACEKGRDFAKRLGYSASRCFIDGNQWYFLFVD